MITAIATGIGVAIGAGVAFTSNIDCGIFLKSAIPAVGGFVFYMGSMLLT